MVSLLFVFILRLSLIEDFMFNTKKQENVQLNWLSICFSISFESDTMILLLNGEKIQSSNKRKSLIEVSGRTDSSSLIVELGSYHFDDTMLIGKIVDVNMWDRYLTYLLPSYGASRIIGNIE